VATEVAWSALEYCCAYDKEEKAISRGRPGVDIEARPRLTVPAAQAVGAGAPVVGQKKPGGHARHVDVVVAPLVPEYCNYERRGTLSLGAAGRRPGARSGN
jgi:hypothetical protein